MVLTVEPTDEVFQNPDVEELVAAQRSREKHVLRHFYLSLLSPFKRVIGEVLAASMMLQLLALALPFFTQVIIDSVLVNRNRQLLFAILAGMVVILVTQIALTYVRNLLITQFKVRFELDFFGRFFDHFIRLEQAYFDTYRREDFINRFQENLKIGLTRGRAQAKSIPARVLELFPVLGSMLKRLGTESRFVRGQRVTDAATMLRRELRWGRVGEMGPVDNDGWQEVDILFELENNAVATVLSLGDRVEVLTPDELREKSGHQNLEDAFVTLVGLDHGAPA